MRQMPAMGREGPHGSLCHGSGRCRTATLSNDGWPRPPALPQAMASAMPAKRMLIVRLAAMWAVPPAVVATDVRPAGVKEQ